MWLPQPDHSGRDMNLGEFLEALIRVAVVRYEVLEEKPDMLAALRMLLEEKILPMAADTHADPFLAVWHHKDFMTMLSHEGNLLVKAFTAVANVDPDMKYYTMSLKEWTLFITKLNIASAGFTQRDIKNTFWRAQGSFAPEFGTMVALKEREEFLEKLHATDDVDVRATCVCTLRFPRSLVASASIVLMRYGTAGKCGFWQHTRDELPGIRRGCGARITGPVLAHLARGQTQRCRLHI